MLAELVDHRQSIIRSVPGRKGQEDRLAWTGAFPHGGALGRVTQSPELTGQVLRHAVRLASKSRRAGQVLVDGPVGALLEERVIHRVVLLEEGERIGIVGVRDDGDPGQTRLPLEPHRIPGVLEEVIDLLRAIAGADVDGAADRQEDRARLDVALEGGPEQVEAGEPIVEANLEVGGVGEEFGHPRLQEVPKLLHPAVLVVLVRVAEEDVEVKTGCVGHT